MTVGGMDYSKYADIANSTRTVNINGEKVQLRGSTSHTSQWSTVSSMHSMVNNGDAYFCTDGADDGEISGKEKAGLFAEGMWNSTKDKAVPTAIAAGTALGIKAIGATALGSTIAATTVGGAIIAAAPVVLGVAAVVGGVALAIKGISTIIKSSQNAKNATTDAEAKQAWGQMGYATTDIAVGTATAVVGAKSLKKTVPKAKQNTELQELGNKAKGLGGKIKDFFGKLFKKGKTNTTVETNQQQLIEVPKPKTNGSTVLEGELIDTPKPVQTNTTGKKPLDIIDVEIVPEEASITNKPLQLNSGKDVIYLEESIGHNYTYDGQTHLDADGYEYAYSLFNS